MRKFIAWLPCMLCYWAARLSAMTATLGGLVYGRLMRMSSRLASLSIRIDEWAGLKFWERD